MNDLWCVVVVGSLLDYQDGEVWISFREPSGYDAASETA